MALDIRDLVRTYVFLNDPDVRKQTTKFGALFVAGIAMMAATFWLSGVSPDDSGAAPTADVGFTEREESCMPAGDVPGWLAENDVRLLEQRTRADGSVCLVYAPGQAGSPTSSLSA